MATNVYGVRVLDVAPDELRARFKVFVLEGGAANPPVPDDPTFFFYALWERGGLADLFDVKTVLDYAWVNANTRRFVARVERVASAKKPLREFDYDVWVTDVRWLEDLTVGDDWDTTFWPFHADVWTPDDAPHIPDLTEPVRRISPFAGTK
ncbi:MAG: hypothetical protein HOV68_01155, partial [Streptomycetaceae bacterium]|nr:hypothetical protein [Streptomycetaceae bacterium]